MCVCARRERNIITRREGPSCEGALRWRGRGMREMCMCYVTDAIDARGELKRGLDLVWFVCGSSADNNSEHERGATRSEM